MGMIEPDTLVLLSGGLDSATLMGLAGERLLGAIFFDYGAAANHQERRCAGKLAEWYGVYLRVFPLAIHRGDMDDREGAPGARVVPARNLIFIACALNYAHKIGAKRIWYGACADDWTSYADCRPSFIGNLNLAIQGWSPNDPREPVIDAPLIWMGKREIVAKARELVVPISDTWSCYTPDHGRPCGTCDGCISRIGVE